MIYLTTLVFPLVAMAAGLAALRAVFSFVAEIRQDMRENVHK